MKIVKQKTLALVIDMQKKIMATMYNENALIKRATFLLKGLHLFDVPMLITQQYTKGLGNSMDFVFENSCEKKFFDKHSFSCARNEKIMQAILDSGKTTIVIAGIEAHVCVLQTCLDLREKGFDVFLINDCISSYRESDMKIAIERAKDAGVKLTTSESLLFELAGDSACAEFKSLSTLVKEFHHD